MVVVVVHIQVKPEFTSRFAEASSENARNSLREPGVAGFEVLQQMDDPEHFVLYEVYYKPEDQLAHRETEHYKLWRDTVADWMAVPRTGTKYTRIFPEDA
jgi:autoinducer 2-degrading protein